MGTGRPLSPIFRWTDKVLCKILNRSNYGVSIKNAHNVRIGEVKKVSKIDSISIYLVSFGLGIVEDWHFCYTHTVARKNENSVTHVNLGLDVIMNFSHENHVLSPYHRLFYNYYLEVDSLIFINR